MTHERKLEEYIIVVREGTPEGGFKWRAYTKPDRIDALKAYQDEANNISVVDVYIAEVIHSSCGMRLG